VRIGREQYLDWMTFRSGLDRPIFSELFGPLIGLPEEWRAQGATEAEIEMTAFDWDYVERVECGADVGVRRTPPVTVSEDEENLIQRDYLGRTTQLCKKTATIPLPLDFPVKTMEDWQKLKPRFAFHEGRINREQIEKAKAAQKDGVLVRGGLLGAFDTVRELMGEENGCLAYYEEPELVADIMATLTDTAAKTYQRVAREIRIDQLSVHEDFAGRAGPMVGPNVIAEHFQPYYLRVWDIVRESGGRIFDLDTDGNVNSVIDALLDCGLTAMHPMEPAAGMDVVEVRRKYGKRLAMRGGIDKHVLRQGREAIRRELEYKLQKGFWTGGIVLGLDHRIPNGTPLDDYRYYVDLGREMLGIPPRSPDRTGWGRMAF
jgi:uroporphyrinogen-III decarboxylase